MLAAIILNTITAWSFGHFALSDAGHSSLLILITVLADLYRRHGSQHRNSELDTATKLHRRETPRHDAAAPGAAAQPGERPAVHHGDSPPDPLDANRQYLTVRNLLNRGADDRMR